MIPSVPKADWAVLFYMVAEPPPGSTTPKGYHHVINTKAQCMLDAIDAAIVGKSIQVGTHVIWDGFGPTGLIQASISGTGLKPAPYDPQKYFAPVLSQLTGHPWADDAAGFFEWALPQLNAKKYAVLFYGHSFGPAGLFDPGSPIVVPAFKPGASPISGTPGPGVKSVSASELAALAPLSLPDLRRILGAFPTKLDLAVFQDCWLATLETAYELSDVVTTVVASQSLVPIVKPTAREPSCIGTWDYNAIFSQLDNPAALVASLKTFYEQLVPPSGEHANMRPNVSIQFSALTLAKVKKLTPALSKIVAILAAPANSKVATGAFPSTAYIDHYHGGILDAGSEALVDVGKVLAAAVQSNTLANGKPANAALATALQEATSAIADIVLATGEASTLPKPLGFGGISVLGGPPSLGGPGLTVGFIRPWINPTDYGQLEFDKQTNWGSLAWY